MKIFLLFIIPIFLMACDDYKEGDRGIYKCHMRYDFAQKRPRNECAWEVYQNQEESNQ